MEKFGKMVPDPLQSSQILAILRAMHIPTHGDRSITFMPITQ